MTRPKAYSYLRMSTDLQLKGDSRRRQLAASKAYAEANGLDLAEDAQLEDIGISAFKGANIKEGAFGKFLDAVKEGSVEKGSYLLVESLDRLTRENILAAQTLLLNVIQSGIILVTLQDQRVYRAESTNIVDLITSLVIMERSHDESKTKSLRIGDAWGEKRRLAQTGKPMTARCPAWLQLSADRTCYELIPERTEIVRQIFSDTVAGMGMYSIASRLNQASIPAFEGKNGWHRSYIAKTLDNRAVLGEFQPCRKVDGKRIPDGEPIQGYYPAIISEDLFFQAKHSTAQRKKSGAGRKGAAYTNLFSGLATCAYCKSKLVFENKGPGIKGGAYLVCGLAQRRMGCAATRWKYSDLEASFLAFVQELDLDSIIDTNDEARVRKEIEAELAALRGELESVTGLMEKTYGMLSQNAAQDFIAGKLNELAKKREDLHGRIALTEARQAEIVSRSSQLYSSKQDLKDLIVQLQGPASNELFRVRTQIASRLKGLVDTLIVAPLGALPKMKKTIDELRTLKDGPEHEVLAYLMQVAEHPEQTRRYFAVGFKDAAVRAVFPTYNDPLHYEIQIETSQFGLHVLKE